MVPYLFGCLGARMGPKAQDRLGGHAAYISCHSWAVRAKLVRATQCFFSVGSLGSR
jgi:hypothetical protein